MERFVLKEIVNSDMAKELENIGFDSSYIHKAKNKFVYKNIKLFSLSLPQANILKQTAISVGADCATPRGMITGDVENMDCVLGGSISQLEKIVQKLRFQPFGLKELAQQIEEFIKPKDFVKTQIAGILNVTDNSFSDGGEFLQTEHAVEHLLQMIQDGADIIDIGAESTKPYSQAVSDDVQLNRLIPILEFVRENNIPVPVSIDTRSSKVAEECLKLGTQIINDVSGFDYDTRMADVIAKYGAKIIIQHSKGTPENMQDNPVYQNVIEEIYSGLKKKVTYAISKGIDKENIIIDPGIGFGKTRDNNFEILRRIEEFKGLGCPVMVGLSRKSLLDMSDEDNSTKDVYTLALNALCIERKVDYIRVHNVKLHKDYLNIVLK